MEERKLMISKWVFFFLDLYSYILQLFANFGLQFLSFMGN